MSAPAVQSPRSSWTGLAASGRWLGQDTRIRVFVVDDHPLACSGLATMVTESNRLQWVGDASSVANALRAAPVAAPDVVLMDEDLPEMSGLHGIQMLRPYLPRCRFVLLTRDSDATLERRARDAGVSCVLLKTAEASDLHSVIQAAFQGHVLPPAAANSPPFRELGSDLTQRERDLLALLTRGLTNHDISAQLGIAVPTVKFHVSNVMAKLGVDNRTAAALVALRHKLVDPR